jgi:hypothetical protein
MSQRGAGDGRHGPDSVWVVARYRQCADSGRTGTAAGHMTIYAQMPDTLALNVNSQVRVADVSVGTVSYLLLPFSLSPQKGAAASVYQQPRRFEGGRASPVVRRRALCPAL